ncbi:MAG: class IV adenylate cyclase [Candidatus Thermoplasmatota archaeon]|nr:class IV adenylate cyclase [Candidatus Thermoplasmatota archaeon]
MIEVELKFRSPGNEKIEKALVKLGAKQISNGPIEDFYFAHPSRDFGKTDEALRLRKREDGAELTYKGPRMHADGAKAREEITLKTDNPLTMQRIVERLGFKESYVLRKTRTSYLLDKLRVDIDDVEGLGEFVELEVLTESPERSKQLLELARAELGLEKLEPKTYLEMIIEKQS